jgi:hypothetical protein
MAWEFGQQIWDALSTEIGNDYGVAGLMGNLVSESGLIPYRLQGDFADGYPASLQYTANVDSGAISESSFVNDAQGYGLAQWTFNGRKQALYNMKVSMNVSSIGDINLGLAYLIYELNNSYPTVLTTLKNATTIREASDTVLHDFENPSVQTPEVEEYRASLGQSVYDTYNGSSPPVVDGTYRKMPIWMMLKW